MPEKLPQSIAIRVPLQAYLSSDHITPATTKTIAVTISKNGAGYGNPSIGATNAVEIGSGSYYVDLSATDTGTLGPLFVLGTSSGVDNVVAVYNVISAISAADANKIADHVRRRTQANVEASSDGDAISVGSHYGQIQESQNSAVSGATLTIKKTDGTTLGTKTLSTDATALPVVGIT